MKIETERFGAIDVDETKILDMKAPILGFHNLRRYILVRQDGNTPFWWLQSVDDGQVAFVVTNPFGFSPDYASVLDNETAKNLELEQPEDILVMSIVTIRSQPLRITVNLRAPVVINIRKHLAGQVVLAESDYPIQFDLVGAHLGVGVASSCAEVEETCSDMAHRVVVQAS